MSVLQAQLILHRLGQDSNCGLRNGRRLQAAVCPEPAFERRYKCRSWYWLMVLAYYCFDIEDTIELIPKGWSDYKQWQIALNRSPFLTNMLRFNKSVSHACRAVGINL